MSVWPLVCVFYQCWSLMYLTMQLLICMFSKLICDTCVTMDVHMPSQCWSLTYMSVQPLICACLFCFVLHMIICFTVYFITWCNLELNMWPRVRSVIDSFHLCYLIKQFLHNLCASFLFRLVWKKIYFYIYFHKNTTGFTTLILL